MFNGGRGRRGDERVTSSVVGVIFVEPHELVILSSIRQKSAKKALLLNVCEYVFYKSSSFTPLRIYVLDF